MRKTIPAVLAVLAAAAVLATGPAIAATKSITVGDNFFIKPGGGTVTVKRGTTVRWVFRGDDAHTVTGSGAGAFINSGPHKTGSYARKVTRKGTYKLICTIHGPKQHMTLIVR